MNKGFTLVELIISIGIFAFMTALLVVKYGNFNQSVLLTNLAYDVALTLRTAQTYGLSVKQVTTAPTVTGTATPTPGQTFKTAYGVNFNSQYNITCGSYNLTKFVMFGDTDLNGVFNDPACNEPVVGSYNLRRGATVDTICIVSNSDPECSYYLSVNITFKRPDPDAIICPEGLDNSTGDCEPFVYAKITIRDPGGERRSVIVRKNGNIDVLSGSSE